MQFANVSRGQAEKVFIVVQEGGDQELIPGLLAQFDATTTVADQGYKVSGVSVDGHATLAPAAPYAGIVDSTISTSDVGRLQVYGPATVRVNAAVTVGLPLTGTTHDSASLGTHICEVASLSANVHYGAGLGIVGTVLAATNATQHAVQLSLL